MSEAEHPDHELALSRVSNLLRETFRELSEADSETVARDLVAEHTAGQVASWHTKAIYVHASQHPLVLAHR